MARRTLPRRPVHPFTADPGVDDWRGRPLCAQPDCGQRADEPIHDLPATDPAVAAVEARRLGEPPEREEP